MAKLASVQHERNYPDKGETEYYYFKFTSTFARLALERARSTKAGLKSSAETFGSRYWQLLWRQPRYHSPHLALYPLNLSIEKN